MSRSSLFSSVEPQGLVFQTGLTYVAILDRRGRPLWEARVRPNEQPQWDGLDPQGVRVPAGSYLCKITDEKGETFYVPFVLLR